MSDAFMNEEVQAEIQKHVDRIAELERKCVEWEKWYAGVVADFAGLLRVEGDPTTLHEWEWMDDYRPAPTRIDVHVFGV